MSAERSRGSVRRGALWLLDLLYAIDPMRCRARSPEGLRCIEHRDHDGLHVPRRGRGWVWG